MMSAGVGIVADIFLGAGAVGAAFYCFILSRKLSRLTGLDQELGSAIALLSQQVDEMSAALVSAQASAAKTCTELEATISEANSLARELSDFRLRTSHNGSQAEPSIHETLSNPEADTGGLLDGTTSLFMRHNKRVAS